MNIFFDFLLIIFSTIILYISYKRVVFNKYSSIANLIIIIIYLFNVLPIIFNYLIGIPDYKTVYWYKPFIEPMNNELIGVIYDIYILLSLIILNIYAKKHNNIDNNTSKSYQVIFNNNIFCFFAILSPLIMIILTGTLSNFLVYSTNSARGLSETAASSMVTPFLFLSIFTFFSKFYNDKKITGKKIFFSFIYFFIVTWISGKRFIIATLTILLIFYITKNNINNTTRKKIFKYLPIVFILILIFSGFYLIAVKPLSDTSFSSVYDMLRVDFGRDDVVKYVISEEFFKHKMILDYRLQSIISLLLFFIPRSIWPTKPYPHYMYLTGHLLNLNILKLPAGTTPSWYEMCLCNFGAFGFIFAILCLPLLCKLFDNFKSLDGKAIGLILIIVLLTQSMDIYIIYILLIIIILIINKFFKGKKIKFTFK